MPTQLIKKYIEEFARWLRNQPDYDDFEYGTEPIAGDRTWCKKCKDFKMKGKNNYYTQPVINDTTHLSLQEE